MSEYRVIDMSAWTQVGQGGNGTTYENPSQPDLILKVDKKQINTLEFVKHEFDISKAVENLGLPTPKMHEMVRVGDLYATISDRIKDKISRPAVTVISTWETWYCQAGKFACFDMILRYEFQKCSLLEKMFFGVYIKRLIKAFYL